MAVHKMTFQRITFQPHIIKPLRVLASDKPSNSVICYSNSVTQTSLSGLNLIFIRKGPHRRSLKESRGWFRSYCLLHLTHPPYFSACTSAAFRAYTLPCTDYRQTSICTTSTSTPLTGYTNFLVHFQLL